jgi:hypothetical protein
MSRPDERARRGCDLLGRAASDELLSLTVRAEDAVSRLQQLLISPKDHCHPPGSPGPHTGLITVGDICVV